MKFNLSTKHQDEQNLALPISSLDLYPQMLKINNVTIVQVVQELYYFCLLTTSSLLPKKPEALEC